MAKVLTSPQLPVGRRITVDDQGSNSEIDCIVVESSDGPPLPAVSRIVYVSSVFGSDTTGNGSAGTPYATIAFAQSTLVPAPTATTVVDIVLYPGEYAEALEVMAFTRLVGFDGSQLDSIVPGPAQVTGAITLGSSFAADDTTAWITNVGLNGAVTFAFTNLNSEVSATGCLFYETVTVTGPTDAGLQLHSCMLWGEYQQTGTNSTWYNTNGTANTDVLHVACGADGAFFSAYGGTWAGTVHADQNAVVGQVVELNFYGFSQSSLLNALTITASGSDCPTVNACLGAVPENPGLAGSAAAQLTRRMQVVEQVIIPLGTAIAGTASTDVLIPLPGSVLGATLIEDMCNQCSPVGTAWGAVLTTANCSISFSFVDNAGVHEIHAHIYNPGAGFNTAADLAINYLGYYPAFSF